MSLHSDPKALENRVNRFFQRLQDKDLIVNDEGMKKKYKSQVGKKSVDDLLSGAMTRWRYNPIDWDAMVDLENIINAAFLVNAISDGEAY